MLVVFNFLLLFDDVVEGLASLSDIADALRFMEIEIVCFCFDVDGVVVVVDVVVDWLLPTDKRDDLVIVGLDVEVFEPATLFEAVAVPLFPLLFEPELTFFVGGGSEVSVDCLFEIDCVASVIFICFTGLSMIR